MEYFRRLGDLVAARWAARGNDKAVFPDIAVAALAEAPAHEHVDPRELLGEVVATPGYVNRGSSDTFGQPGVPVYLAEKFHIEVLYWFTGTTGIHEHAFQGAFQLLSGSSVHGSYRFDVTDAVSKQFLLGHTRLQHIELLERGDTRRIEPGAAGIHSLFHMDHPSTTVVVRTHNDPNHRPQLYYAAPHLAIDGFFQDRSIVLRQRCLAAACQIDPSSLEPLTRRALEGAEPIAMFMLLMTYASLERDAQRRRAFFSTLRAHHGQLIDTLAAVIEAERRVKDIHALRADVRDTQLRFFLALMLNCPDRASTLALAARRAGDETIESIARWVAQLAPLPGVLGRELAGNEVTELQRALASGTELPPALASLPLLAPLSR